MKRVPIHAPTAPSQPKVAPSMRVKDAMGGDKQFSDTLQNLVTGLGTSKDKSTATTFAFVEMDKMQLESAVRSDWIARKVVDIPAKDATREWRTWQSDKQDIKSIEEVELNLHLQRKTYMAMAKARLYGGACLLMGVDQGKIEEPLDVEKVGKDQLKFIHVVSRWELSEGEIDWDIQSEFYGTPKYYTRAQQGNTDLGQIHPSRVVRFLGNEVPDITLTKGWGDSVLQVVYDAIIAAGTAMSNGAQILNEIKMDILKIPDLSAVLSNKVSERRLMTRLGTANVAKSLYNILLLDKDEDWERVAANLAGIPDILRMYLLIASGAADIPATRMLGQSPVGLSATGDSDLRNYYDHVKSEQSTVVAPAMVRLDEVMIRSALGTTTPKDTTFEWRSLWQIEEQLRSTVIRQKSESFKVDVDAGLIPPEVLRDARINQLIEDGVYPGLDLILEDYGPLDPITEPTPGVVLGPDGKPIPPTSPLHPANQAQIDPKTGKPIQPPVAANQNKAQLKKAIGDMTKRIRNRKLRKGKGAMYAADARLQTLYVYRPVLNAKDIIDWANAQGIDDVQEAAELHVTICYSTTPVDWSKAGEGYGQDEKGNLTIKPGGMRMVDKFGNALVLVFTSNDLTWRHCQIKEATGAEWSYADYQPHITISWLKDQTKLIDLEKIEPYQGEIKFGPEVFEETKADYMLSDEHGNPYEKESTE